MKPGLFLAAIFAALALWPGQARAQPFRTENVETELHAARAAIAPGERFTVVLRQKIREHWHTYWRNPGDSGEPTEIEWRLPGGWRAGPIEWPAPEAIPFDILVNYGYSNEVLFPIELTAPRNLRVGGEVTLSAHVYWLVCSDICIPEEGDLTLTLPVSARGRDDPEWGARISEERARLPRRDEAILARVSPGGGLGVALPLAAGVSNSYFFPYERGVVEAAAPQRPEIGPAGLSFSLSAGPANNLGRAPLAGVLVYDVAEAGGVSRAAFEINAEPGPALPGTDGAAVAMSTPALPSAVRGEASSALTPPALAVALVLALLGGLVLNVMPCVLPMLSIKALSLAGGAHAGEGRRHGVLYLAGVMASVLTLAGIFLALRGSGEALGWGFQLQSPWVTSGLALLFFAIGLNLLGVFEVAGAWQGMGGGLARRGGDAGAFFTGALAVVAATPCTAPFMAGAVGVAATQSAPVALAVFAALGLGFALPLVALSFAPGLQRLLPKPGAWMERFKQVLAFPMFAAAVWMAWVLTTQTGASGVLALLATALALGFALTVARWGRVWLIAGLLALAATGALVWRPLAGQAQAQALALASEPWSPARVAALQAEGRPVFVNFTAAWCATCKVNEALVFSRARVAQAFERSNTAFLVADWTNPNPEISAALDGFGRAGIPVYVYYAPGQAEPLVLPLDRFSETYVLELIEGESP